MTEEKISIHVRDLVVVVFPIFYFHCCWKQITVGFQRRTSEVQYLRDLATIGGRSAEKKSRKREMKLHRNKRDTGRIREPRGNVRERKKKTGKCLIWRKWSGKRKIIADSYRYGRIRRAWALGRIERYRSNSDIVEFWLAAGATNSTKRGNT